MLTLVAVLSEAPVTCMNWLSVERCIEVGGMMRYLTGMTSELRGFCR